MLGRASTQTNMRVLRKFFTYFTKGGCDCYSKQFIPFTLAGLGTLYSKFILLARATVTSFELR